ncbi:MAG: nucleotide exchange factor GrpE [Chloroflexota bacterium]
MSKKKTKKKQETTPSMSLEQRAAVMPVEAGALAPESPPEQALEAAPQAPSAEEAEAVSLDPFQALQAELDQAKVQAAEYLDGWQRSRADFLNYKKRVEREMETAHAAAAASILSRQLVILDDLERALKERPNLPEIDAWTAGLELIYRKLQGILESEGVEPIPAKGELFDPAVHEAITFEHVDGHREGEVIDVIEQGYKLGDRVLRAAKVRVAR